MISNVHISLMYFNVHTPLMYIHFRLSEIFNITYCCDLIENIILISSLSGNLIQLPPRYKNYIFA